MGTPHEIQQENLVLVELRRRRDAARDADVLPRGGMINELGGRAEVTGLHLSLTVLSWHRCIVALRERGHVIHHRSASVPRSEGGSTHEAVYWLANDLTDALFSDTDSFGTRVSPHYRPPARRRKVEVVFEA